jgi:hypothetical protein
MFKIAALNDKLHQKMVEEGIPDAIAAYVSDDENRVPGDTRKFVAKALAEKLGAVEKKKKKQIDPAEFVGSMEAEIGQIRDWLTYGTEADGTALNMHRYKTWDDMQQAAHEWHRVLTQQMASQGHPLLYKEDNPAHTLEQFKGGWRVVDVPQCDLKNEGNLMGHCVGRGGYDRGVSDGTTQIISLRDKQGIPHVTIEATKEGGGTWSVRQVQGKGNQPPVDKYKSVLYDFFNKHRQFKIPSYLKARILPADKMAFELAKQFIEDPTSYEVARVLETELPATEHQKFYDVITKYYSEKEPEEVAELLNNADPDIIDGLLQTARDTGNMQAFNLVLQSGTADDSLFGFSTEGKDYYGLPEEIRYKEMMRRFNDPPSLELLARYLDSMPPNMLLSPAWRGVMDQALDYFDEHGGESKNLDEAFKRDMFPRIAKSYLRIDSSPEEFAAGLERIMRLAIKFPDKRVASHILWVAKKNPDLIKDAIDIIDDEGLLWTLKDYLDAYRLDKEMEKRFESHDEVPEEYISESINPQDRKLEPTDTWSHDRPKNKGRQWGPLLDPLRDKMDVRLDQRQHGGGWGLQETFPEDIYEHPEEEQAPVQEEPVYEEPAVVEDEDDDDDYFASRSLRERLIKIAIRCEREGEIALADRLERAAILC